jgi:serine/threonine protein kinase
MARLCPTCQIEWADDVDTCPDDGAPLPYEDRLIGTTLGSYKILKRLGKGGMGSVYLGEHPVIGSKVAIKVLHAQFSRDKSIVDRFFNEARAVNLIGHENILKILDLNATEDGTRFFVMEFLEGRSLQALVDERAKGVEKWLPYEESGPVLLQVAEALHAAHEKNIVHRDLKPDNIFLVTRNGKKNFVKVVDFGIARLSDASGMSTGQTQAGMVMGTPGYMSPEQAAGATDRIDRRSDVYSMGVLMFQLFTGRMPFLGKSFSELLIQHVQKEPPRPRSVRPALPGSVENVILTALKKAQDERFQTMAELGEALRMALRAASLPTTLDGGAKPAPRAMPKKPPTPKGASDTLADGDDIPALTVPEQARVAPPPRVNTKPPVGRALPRPVSRPGFGEGAGSTVPIQGGSAGFGEGAGSTVPMQADNFADGAGGTVPMERGDGPLATVPLQAPVAPAVKKPGPVSAPVRATPSQRTAAQQQKQASSGAGKFIAIGVVVLAVLGGGAWFALSDDTPEKPTRKSRAASDKAAADKAAAKAEANSTQTTIQVASEPAGASVLASWDNGGSSAGTTPWALEVPKGVQVELIFSLEGYAPKTQKVASSQKSVSVQLRAASAAPAAPAPKPPKGDAPPKANGSGKEKKEELVDPF